LLASFVDFGHQRELRTAPHMKNAICGGAAKRKGIPSTSR
jgi:hypothetical protein